MEILLNFSVLSKPYIIIEAVILPFSIVMNAKVLPQELLGRDILPGFITKIPPSFSR